VARNVSAFTQLSSNFGRVASIAGNKFFF